MKVGVFTPLLSALPLDDVLKKLKSLNIDTVEFGTGNYPGDAHAKLSMLDNPAELAHLQKQDRRCRHDHLGACPATAIRCIPTRRFPTSIARPAARPSCWRKSWA